MDSIVLLGDSLFQRAFTQEKDDTGQIIGSLGPRLSDAYMRKLDVINRGFSGYNTQQVLEVLRGRNSFLPRQSLNVRGLTVIFLGANDARLPDTPGGPQQHVPLEKFKANLAKITSRTSTPASVLLITPPPVDERQTVVADSRKDPALKDVVRRRAVVTADYAQAVRDVGSERKIPVLDLWAIIMKKAGYNASVQSPARDSSDELDTEYLDEYDKPTTGSKIAKTTYDERMLPGSSAAPVNNELRSHFIDGLHFSRKGYDLLFDKLMKAIRRDFPHLAPEKLPFVLPAWDDEEKWSGDVSELAMAMKAAPPWSEDYNTGAASALAAVLLIVFMYWLGKLCARAMNAV